MDFLTYIDAVDRILYRFRKHHPDYDVAVLKLPASRCSQFLKFLDLSVRGSKPMSAYRSVPVEWVDDLHPDAIHVRLRSKDASR